MKTTAIVLFALVWFALTRLILLVFPVEVAYQVATIIAFLTLLPSWIEGFQNGWKARS